MAGPGFADATSAPAAARTYLDEVGANTGRLRIGFMRKLPGDSTPLHPEAILAVERAARLLVELGHDVEEANPAPLASTEHFELIMSYLPLKVVQRLSESEQRLGREFGEDDLEPATYRMLTSARELNLVSLGVTLGKIHEYTRRTLQW